MIRPITRDDRDAIISVASASGLFNDEELPEVVEMLYAYLSGDLGPDHHWTTFEDQEPVGVAYHAPEPFTSGVWNMYMLKGGPLRRSAEFWHTTGKCLLLSRRCSCNASSPECRETQLGSAPDFHGLVHLVSCPGVIA